MTEQRDHVEVQRFIEAANKLEAFKDKHPKLFNELYALVDEYNQALQEADKAVRSTGETCGPFVREKIVVKYDADKLYDALGHDSFLSHGGVIATVSKYTVDKQRFESLVSSGVIPPVLVADVKNVIPHYKKIDKLVI